VKTGGTVTDVHTLGSLGIASYYNITRIIKRRLDSLGRLGQLIPPGLSLFRKTLKLKRTAQSELINSKYYLPYFKNHAS